MKYWIFKANPKKYRLDDRLADPNPHITWKVLRYRDELQAGDQAFIWRTGKDRGIVAIMDLDSQPEVMAEIKSEVPYCTNLDNTPCWRVRGRLTRHFPCIPSTTLKGTPGLANLSMFHGYQRATNFKVTADEAAILLGMIG